LAQLLCLPRVLSHPATPPVPLCRPRRRMLIPAGSGESSRRCPCPHPCHIFLSRFHPGEPSICYPTMNPSHAGSSRVAPSCAGRSSAPISGPTHLQAGLHENRQETDHFRRDWGGWTGVLMWETELRGSSTTKAVFLPEPNSSSAATPCFLLLRPPCFPDQEPRDARLV
jgi:hypothetical protein